MILLYQFNNSERHLLYLASLYFQPSGAGVTAAEVTSAEVTSAEATSAEATGVE